ncbi:TrkH family potassium uptake protein [Desulfococcus sp.]|uniref:TrkH family potassium uptake protein n=1 Tax=Desulfococcus sp. TaxID=2025834 RepID=UPI003D0F3CA6
MRWHYIFYVVGILLFFLGLFMLLPLATALIYRDEPLLPHFLSIGVCLAVGGLLFLSLRGKNARNDYVSPREGMGIVAVGWMAVGAFGALPFYLGGQFGGITDCLFESVSGFTTTGASILREIEPVSKGMLLWRSFIQWLGGMGIIVLSLAILPILGVGGMQLYKAEVPSPVPDKLKPRIRDTAMILWKVYALITAVEVVLLMFGGMDLFDALNHAFTTLPTGGFSTENASVAHFDSGYIDMVITLFMLLAGINFTLHYQFLKGQTLAFWRDAECRFFLGTTLFLTLVIAFDIFGTVYETAAGAFRYSVFQAASIITTTGFATADYEQWPAMSQIILLLCMFIGGSAGSTGGGMKCLRVMVCFKYCYKELFSLIHPHAVTHVKIAGKTVPEDVVRSVLGFLALYMMLFAVAVVLLAGTGVDLVTAFGAVAAAIGNIGPGLGMVGPVENYADIPLFGKWILIWCMLLGRLEIYTVIILLVPEFWRK